MIHELPAIFPTTDYYSTVQTPTVEVQSPTVSFTTVQLSTPTVKTTTTVKITTVQPITTVKTATVQSTTTMAGRKFCEFWVAPVGLVRYKFRLPPANELLTR